MFLLNKFDINLLLLIHHTFQNEIFDKIMPLITDLGNLGLIWIIISVGLLINKKSRYIGIICLCSLLLTTIIGEGILKHLIKRPRPFMVLSNINMLIPKPSSYSFPSGHTASSFASAVVISKGIKKLKWPVIILAFLIAFSRLYLYVHYPSDVLAGAALGILCSKFVLSIFAQRFPGYKNIHETEVRKLNNNI